MRRFSSFLFASAVSVLASAASAQTPAPAAPPQLPAPPAAWTAPPAAPYAAPGPWAPVQYAPAPGYGYGYGPPGAWWPPPAPMVPRGTERRSRAMMITGFTLAGVGATALAAGAVFYKAATSIVYDIACFEGPCSSPSPPTGAPIAVMAIGGALFAVGLPIGIYGSTSKPPESMGRWAPEVALGPTSAKLHWSF